MRERHGQTKTRLHNIWLKMKHRCSGRSVYYDGYKNISVDNKWANNFMVFKEWSDSNGYSDELTLDRIDTLGDYTPNNCRWATKSTQAQNSKMRKSNTSGATGIRKIGTKFYCRITINGKETAIKGSTSTLEEAVIKRRLYIDKLGTEHKTNCVSN